MPELIVLVGPQGSGKSTYANEKCHEYFYINQDTQGREGHLAEFKKALDGKYDIVVDRINHLKEQRKRYIEPAKLAGYSTKIIVFHENYATCLKRISERKDHPTIHDVDTGKKALGMFFSKYERVDNDEADAVVRLYPEGPKIDIIVNDIDGCLANLTHRLHFVKGEGKKDWKSFFNELSNDKVNEWNKILLNTMSTKYHIVCCSGRPHYYHRKTQEWLDVNGIKNYDLHMRFDGDFRSDDIAKEILLDFELLTRYNIVFVIDDRKRVVDMWRKRGITCLQCAEGEF